MRGQEQVQEVQRLFLKHGGIIKGFIVGLLPDFNAADDVYQEVFMTLTEKASSFRAGTNFPAWARSVARRKVLEHLRTRRSVPRPLSPEALDAVADYAAEVDESFKPLASALADCLDDLAPRSKEVVALRYAENLSPTQIAERLSWTVNAINVALSRVRRFLRDCTQRKMRVGEA